jgi:hypothetical protein
VIIGAVTVLLLNSFSILNEISPLLNITLFAVELILWPYLARASFAQCCGTVTIFYGSGSDFLTSYGSSSGSTRQKVTVPKVPVPVPQHWFCTYFNESLG